MKVYCINCGSEMWVKRGIEYVRCSCGDMMSEIPSLIIAGKNAQNSSKRKKKLSKKQSQSKIDKNKVKMEEN